MAFIDDMAAALDAADLIIARGGAMTVSEIALAGRAAIFVPYPFHRDRQQELNARVIERRRRCESLRTMTSSAKISRQSLRELLPIRRMIEMGR